MGGVIPGKKSRLSQQGKAIAAAHVFWDTVEGSVDEEAAERWLREEVRLQWSMLTCLQYLSGMEALAALKALPNNWLERGRTKRHLQGASILAAQALASMRRDGKTFCASDFAQQFRGKAIEQWLAQPNNASQAALR